MAFDAQSLIVSLTIGAVAGWLASQLMRGVGFGLIGNICQWARNFPRMWASNFP